MGDTIQPTTVWSPRFFSTVNAASSGALCYQGCGHSSSLSHTHIVKVRVSAGRLPLGAPRVGPPSVSGVPLCPTRTRDRREGLPTDGSRTRPRQAACSLPSPTAAVCFPENEPGDKGDRELRRRDCRPSSSELSRAHLGLGAALGLQVASLPTSSPSSSCACLCPNLLGTAATLDQGPPQ